jgi:hypothetical protein
MIERDGRVAGGRRRWIAVAEAVECGGERKFASERSLGGGRRRLEEEALFEYDQRLQRKQTRVHRVPHHIRSHVTFSNEYFGFRRTVE